MRRPTFPDPRDCVLLATGTMVGASIGHATGAYVQVAGKHYFAPGIQVRPGAGGSVLQIAVWGPPGTDPHAVVGGWSIAVNLAGGKIAGTVAANHSGYIVGLGGSVAPDVNIEFSHAFDLENLKPPDEFNPPLAGRSIASVLADTVGVFSRPRKQIRAELARWPEDDNGSGYGLYKALLAGGKFVESLPQVLRDRWAASKELAAIHRRVAAEGGEAALTERKAWAPLTKDLKREVLAFFEREVARWSPPRHPSGPGR